MSKNKDIISQMSRINEIEREFLKEKKKVTIGCSHKNNKGKLKLNVLSEHGEYECKICRQRFNLEKIEEGHLRGAIKVVHDAIQQIRCYSDTERDAKLIRLLGELDYNVQEVTELYGRVINVYGNGKNNKNNKNKNRDERDGFGSYGSGSLSFLGGKKR